jgi:hypothetical protein
VRTLKFTAKVYGLKLSDDQISRLNEAKLNLDPFPDSRKGLEKLNETVTKKMRKGRTILKPRVPIKLINSIGKSEICSLCTLATIQMLSWIFKYISIILRKNHCEQKRD